MRSMGVVRGSGITGSGPSVYNTTNSNIAFDDFGGMQQAAGFNMGGLVPGYNMGGMVEGYNRGGLVKGLLGGALVYQGGQMLGEKVGGGLGSAIQNGSMIASSLVGFGAMGSRGDQKGPGFLGRQMDKVSPGLKQPIGPLNSLSKSLTNLTGRLGGIGKMFGPLLRGFTMLLRLTSPLGLAITGVTAASKR
jgi:hypothetical protein